jgi:hypothetical protein
MFGHLKAEEFVDLVEGAELTPERRAHLNSCSRCSAEWKSLAPVHAEFSALDNEVPEADWEQFRNSVRNELLSRSVQRASAVRRWTGWPIRPAMAWGLSLVFAVAVTTGGFLWHSRRAETPTARAGAVVSTPVEGNLEPNSLEANSMNAVLAAWSQTDLFDELVNLEEPEQEALRRMLTVAQQGSVEPQ